MDFSQCSSGTRARTSDAGEAVHPHIYLCGPLQYLAPPRQRSMIGLINGIDVPIGVGSLTSCVRTRIARRSKYEANMPVEITATMEIMLVL